MDRCPRGGLDQTCDAWCGSDSGWRAVEALILTSRAASWRCGAVVPEQDSIPSRGGEGSSVRTGELRVPGCGWAPAHGGALREGSGQSLGWGLVGCLHHISITSDGNVMGDPPGTRRNRLVASRLVRASMARRRCSSVISMHTGSQRDMDGLFGSLPVCRFSCVRSIVCEWRLVRSPSGSPSKDPSSSASHSINLPRPDRCCSSAGSGPGRVGDRCISG
jgi:hypothetical protein